MQEGERRGGGLQRMAPVVAREAGASPVTAREAIVAREDPVASTAAPVALIWPHGSGGVGGGSGGVDDARLWWLRGCRRRQETAAKWGDGESGRQRRGGVRDLGEKWWPGGNGFLVKSNLAVALFAKRAIAKLAIAIFTKRATAIAM